MTGDTPINHTFRVRKGWFNRAILQRLKRKRAEDSGWCTNEYEWVDVPYSEAPRALTNMGLVDAEERKCMKTESPTLEDAKNHKYDRSGYIKLSSKLPPLPLRPDPSNQAHVDLLYDYAAERLFVEFAISSPHFVEGATVAGIFRGYSRFSYLGDFVLEFQTTEYPNTELARDVTDVLHLTKDDKYELTGRAIDFDGNYHDVAIETGG